MNWSLANTNVVGSDSHAALLMVVGRWTHQRLLGWQDQVVLVVGKVFTTLAAAVNLAQVNGQGNDAGQYHTAQSNKNSYRDNHHHNPSIDNNINDHYYWTEYSTLAKFMKNVLLLTDLLLKTEHSKAFIYFRVRAIIFLKNELCTEMNQACEYNFFVFLQ